MSRINYRVISTDPTIHTEPVRAAVIHGKVVTEDEQFCLGVATDGSTFEGQKITFNFKFDPGLVDVNDIISAEPLIGKTSWITNVALEVGRNAITPSSARTVPYEIPEPAEIEPPATTMWPWEEALANHRPLSERDIISLAISYRALRSAFIELTQRVKQLEQK